MLRVPEPVIVEPNVLFSIETVATVDASAPPRVSVPPVIASVAASKLPLGSVSEPPPVMLILAPGSWKLPLAVTAPLAVEKVKSPDQLVSDPIVKVPVKVIGRLPAAIQDALPLEEPFLVKVKPPVLAS